VAGVELALGVSVGLGSSALARAGGFARPAWVLAGVLAGTFATHLVAGYVSNLVFAVVFLAAVAVLADPSRRAVVAAAILLGAGGLAHPLFFLVGAVILLGAAIPLRARGASERAQSLRALAAVAGGGAIVGAGLALAFAGPPTLHVDTSQDAFLRRAGLGDTLAGAYRDRLFHRWTRYVQWASVPLALFGARLAGGWVRRALWAWLAVTVAGVAVGLVTEWVPPDRFITFGYTVPILAAAGVVRLRDRRRRRLAMAVASGLVLAMVAGSGIAWLREKPYLGRAAVDDVEIASAYASRAPEGTPWVFPVDSTSTRSSFVATRLQNLIRAAVPPDRIRDVFVVVPPPPADAPLDDRREWEAMASLYARDSASRGVPPVVVEVAGFDLGSGRRSVCRPPVCAALEGPMTEVADGVRISAPFAAGAPTPVDRALDSSRMRMAIAAPVVLAVLALVGFGWSSLVVRERAWAAALSPAFGAAALVIGGFAADRAGVRLSGAGPGLLVLAIAGGAGYLGLLAERRRGADAPA
jgi:hypothetical protein